MKSSSYKHLKKHVKIAEDALFTPSTYVTTFYSPVDDEILHSKSGFFGMLEESLQKEMMKMFRKTFGKLGSKTRIVNVGDEQHDGEGVDGEDMRESLTSVVSTHGDSRVEAQELMEKVLAQISQFGVYDQRVVIHILVGSITHANHEEDNFHVMLMTVNQLAKPKTKYAIVSQEEFNFDTVVETNPIIDTNPLDAIFYPSIDFGDEGEQAKVEYDKALYTTKKPAEPTVNFVQRVLGGFDALPPTEEEHRFKSIIRNVMSTVVTARQLEGVYEDLADEFRGEGLSMDEMTFSMTDLQGAIRRQNIEVAMPVEDAYREVLGNTTQRFNVNYVLPTFQKNDALISSNGVEVKIRYDQLKDVHQVKNAANETFLMIKVEDGVRVDSTVELVTRQLTDGFGE